MIANVVVVNPAVGDPHTYAHASARLQINEHRIDSWYSDFGPRNPDGSLSKNRWHWLRQLTKLQRERTDWGRVYLAAMPTVGKA